MDKITFQSKLLYLKKRFAQMVALYKRSPSRLSSSPYSSDAFSDDIRELKARLASMQSSLHHFNNPQALPRPVGSLFCQQFASLRDDVCRIKMHVTDLEQNVSDLEDRVDHCLNPVLTPAASDDDQAPQKLGPEGAASRDGEIARLEELLYQDNLSRSQETLTRKEIVTRQLQLQNARLEHDLAASNSALLSFSDAFNDNQLHIKHLEGYGSGGDAAVMQAPGCGHCAAKGP